MKTKNKHVVNTTCAICGKQFKSVNILSRHLKTHNISAEEYFLKYIDMNCHIKCPFCNVKNKKFHSLAYGYYLTCGDQQCQQKSREKTMLTNYGITNVFQRKDVIEKIQEKVEPKRKQITDKIRQTRYNKNDGKWHSTDYPEKRLETLIANYGDEPYKELGKLISESKQNRTQEQIQLELQHFKQSMLKKYGYEFPMQVPEIKEAFRQYCLDTYNVKSTLELIHVGRISKLNRRIIKILEDNNINFEKEFKIRSGTSNKYYDVKFDNNVLLEINGDYFHANPTKYHSNDVFVFHNVQVTAMEIWNGDLLKKKLAEDNGYLVKYIWESDMKKMSDEQILSWIIENCNIN